MAGGPEFADFVTAHSRSLFGTAFVLTGDGGAAEELVQDTLAALYPKWPRVQAADAPIAYVRRALVNRFVSAGRQTQPAVMWELPEPAPGRDAAEDVDDRDLIRRLLGRLSPRARAAIVLRHLHDLSDDQIADILGCRRATVRSLISRGLAELRPSAPAGPDSTNEGARR